MIRENERSLRRERNALRAGRRCSPLNSALQNWLHGRLHGSEGVPKTPRRRSHFKSAKAGLRKGEESGGSCRIRTYDLRIKSPLLYQLS
jgi:hypothetical protein